MATLSCRGSRDVAAIRLTAGCHAGCSARARLATTRPTTDRHFLASSDNLCRVTFLECRQAIDSLISLGIFYQQIFVDVLLEVIDFLNMRIVLVINVVCHEVHGL